MEFKAKLFVTLVMGIPAISLIYCWRNWSQTRKVPTTGWRTILPILGLYSATLSHFLVSGFLIHSFRGDAQSFVTPAPLFWIILNWISVLFWGVALSSAALGQGRLRLPLFLWNLSMPLAAWLVTMIGLVICTT